jgi:hypothetical protein
MAHLIPRPPTQTRMTSPPELLRRGCSRSLDPATAARELHEAIHQEDTALGVFFCSPEYDLDALAEELGKRFGDTELIGCTTAGEIGPEGFTTSSITGFTLGGEGFRAATGIINGVEQFEISQGGEIAERLTRKLREQAAGEDKTPGFGFLLVDGLSVREEGIVSSLHAALGDVPLFGGSAGDGLRFEKTWVYQGGRFHENAAVVSLVETDLPFTVFKSQHFVPSDEKMVVTEADATNRVVTEINGGPAGEEYAEAVGLEVDKLTPMVFSTHPVVVRIGGADYVRSIQQVNEDGSLTFFCAIDEGIVLTVARGVGLVENLSNVLHGIREEVGTPQIVIGCDCILRRLEIAQKELEEEVNALVEEYNLVGFSTYGEQFNGMHVNQTFTGVAIGYPREDAA